MSLPQTITQTRVWSCTLADQGDGDTFSVNRECLRATFIRFPRQCHNCSLAADAASFFN